MTHIISSVGGSDPKSANIQARVVQPEGDKLLQVDIYEREENAKAGRRSYRIHLTKEAVRQMMRLLEGKE